MVKKYIMFIMITMSWITTGFGSQVSEQNIQQRLLSAVMSQQRGEVRELLSQGADINAGYAEGCTLLHFVIMHGQFEQEYLKFLIENGADVNAQVDGRNTPLHDAAFLGYQAAVQILLDHGADLETETEKGDTPLFSAVHGGNLDFVRWLLQTGAQTVSKNGKSILDAYLDHQKSKSIAQVWQVEADFPDVHFETVNDEEEIVHPGKLRANLSEVSDDVKSVLVFLYLYGIPKTDAWHFLFDNVPGLRERFDQEMRERKTAISEGLKTRLSVCDLRVYLLSYVF